MCTMQVHKLELRHEIRWPGSEVKVWRGLERQNVWIPKLSRICELKHVLKSNCLSTLAFAGLIKTPIIMSYEVETNNHAQAPLYYNSFRRVQNRCSVEQSWTGTSYSSQMPNFEFISNYRSMNSQSPTKLAFTQFICFRNRCAQVRKARQERFDINML
jgi:hypothetical protein